MYFTTHLLGGAAVGAVVGQPVAAFAAGVLSHAGLDAVPHNDYHQFRYAAIDILLGSAVYFLFVRQLGPGVELGAIGGFLPDLEVALNHTLASLRPGLRWRNVFPSHSGVTPHGSASCRTGFFIQVAVSLLALAVLTLARRGGL